MATMLTACNSKGKGDSPDSDGTSDAPEITQEELQKERDELEAKRKEEMGEFYVALPPLDEEGELVTVKAKALYITGNVAGFKFDEENINYYSDYIKAISKQSDKSPDASRLDEINKLEKALGIAKASEINALVIDVKSDDGDVTWKSDLDIVKEVGTDATAAFAEYGPLLDYMDKNEIYKIARIVAFKDPLFAAAKPEHAIQLKDGGVYLDHSNDSWVNPFDKYVWDYVVSLSAEAALRGFDEIQYDYVRFPDRAAEYNSITVFPGRDDRDKDEGIEDFLAYAKEKLEAYNVHITADVFGIVTRSWNDTPDDIGQTWRKIANQVDYISPMIYPSHYGPGLYGYSVPDQHPYGVARAAVMEAIERNASQKDPAIIRPWFQGFNAPWIAGHINYGPEAVSDQMVAAYELGVEEYIIWNASNNYDPLSFFFQDRVDPSVIKEGKDLMDRSPEETLEIFLTAEQRSRTKELYLLTLISERNEDYDKFVEEMEKTNPVLDSYTINSLSDNDGEGYLALVDVSYRSDQGIYKNEKAEFEIVLENEVFKVKKPKMEWVEEASEETKEE